MVQQKRRLQNLLEEKNLRKTSQRALVWESLLEADDHPSVEELRERLLEKGHRVGLSTIYRTLKILLESGMIRQAKVQGMTRYEPLINQPNHIHFVCNRCGLTEEYPSRRIERLLREETDKHDFRPLYSRYAISGLCKTCSTEDALETGVDERARQQTVLARDALELTLAVERRGYSFYTNASKKTRDPSGKRMFELLAEEESGHMDRLQQEYRELLSAHRWLRREPARLPASRKIADEIFPERELLHDDVDDHMTRIEALSLAIALEQKSHQFFRNFAKELDDPRGRRLFQEFAREERAHLESLREEYARLTGKEGKEGKEDGEGASDPG
jgi:Fur family ferric uptake transcriptional regulator